MPPFLQSPQVSLTVAAFLGAQGGDQSPLLPVGVGSCLGTGPGALPYPVTIPGELVCHSSESSWGLAIRRVGTLVQKRTRNTIRWRVSSFVLGFIHSSPAEPPVWLLKGPAWLESCWDLQKPVLKKPSTTLGELENQVYYAGGPRGVNTLSSGT